LQYSLKRSPRAKTVRFTVTPDQGLVVTVPQRFNLARLPSIIEEKNAWIERSLAWAAEQRIIQAARPPFRLPDVIFLQSIGETWDVVYRSGTSGSKASAVERKGDILSVCGDPDNPVEGREALQRWLSRKARKGLAPFLEELAGETSLSYERIRIGSQRTLWASCSPRGTISLNRKMLFLPPRLVRYLLLHELCHTVQMNHSRRFWALLAGHEPDCRALDRELHRAGRFTPAWAE
jgi:hypothetical protein